MDRQGTVGEEGWGGISGKGQGYCRIFMHVSGDVLLEASGTANVTPMSRKCRDEQRSRDLGWRERVEKQRRRGRCEAKCNTIKKGSHSRNRERRNRGKEEQEEASLWWASI